MPALRVQGLSRTIRHGDGELHVVHDLSLVVPEGRAVGITGSADSGWKSALRLIAGLDPRTEGGVDLLPSPGDTRAAPVDLPAFRQEVFFASALDPLLDGDIETLPRRLGGLDASRRRQVGRTTARALFSAAGVEAGRAAASLTRGERLLLCLAIAAWLNPSQILVEVEGLEPRERKPLVGLMRRLLDAGIGMLVGSRDEIVLAAVCRAIVILEDGAVLAEGEPGVVLPAATAEARREGLL